MEITVPRVIATWGVANGVLVAVLVGYDENVFAIALYASAVGLLELVALAAWWSGSRRPGRAVFSPAMPPARPAAVAASAVPFLGLGFVYKPWMMLGAVYPLATLAAHALRRLLPDVGDEAEPESASAHESPTVRPVIAAGAVVTMAGVARLLRRRRR